MHGESIDRRRFGSRKGIEAAVRGRSALKERELGIGGETGNAVDSIVEGVFAVKRRAKGQSHGWITQSHSHSHSHCNSNKQRVQRIKLIGGV